MNSRINPILQKSFLFRQLLLCCLLSIFGLQAKAQQLVEEGQLFVKLRGEYQADLTYQKGSDHQLPVTLFRLCQQYDVQSIKHAFQLDHPALRDIYLLEYDHAEGPEELAKRIDALQFVAYAEPVPHYENFYTPNDINAAQWHIATILAEQAWDLTTGNGNVTIAIIDDAVLMTHQDLAGNIWTNPGEIPGDNLDNDNNGYVDDVNGWDAADNDNDPSPPAFATNSIFTHGTHVAGIAGAVTDNGIGMASVGFDVKIIPVKIKEDATMGPGLQAGYQGIEYAVATGCDVINMSWGGSSYSATYQAILNVAFVDSGIVCVAAAGNSSTQAPMYPASYTNVMSVGATVPGDIKANFSNYGPTIDVMAPGQDIYSTLAGNNTSYGLLSGTSMASPIVAGLASLLKARNGTVPPQTIVDCIVNTCDNIDAQNPTLIGLIGAGRVNAFEALKCISPIYADFTCFPSFICQGGVVQFTDLSLNNPTSWEWSFPGGNPSTSTAQNPLITYNTNGQFDVELIVHNADGSDTLLLVNHVTVGDPVATILGNATIYAGGSTYLQVNFTGNPPWDFTYTDGITNFTINGVTSNPYYIQVSPTDTTDYWITAMNDSLCTGSGADTATIIVLPPSACQSEPSFYKSFSSPDHDEGHSISLTYDGGAIIAGTTEGAGAGGKDILLIKADSLGNTQWIKTLGGVLDDYSFNVHASQTLDSGYIVTGATANFGGSSDRIYLAKLSAAGLVQWDRVFGNTSGGPDYGRAIHQNPDSTYVFCATLNPGPNGNSDGYMVKLDQNGIIIWERVFGTSGNDHLDDVKMSHDGHFIAAGNSTGLGSGRRATIIKADFNTGAPIWEKSVTVPGFSDVSFNTIELTSDSGYIATGYVSSGSATSRDWWVMKVDSAANMEWSNRLFNTQEDVAASSVQLGDNSYLTSGFTTVNGVRQIGFVRTDQLGIILEKRTLIMPSESPFWGHNMSQTAEGGAMVTGWVNGGVNGDDLFYMKYNSCIETMCNEIPLTISDNAVSPSVNNVTMLGGTVGQQVAFSLLLQDALNFNETIDCTSPILLCDSAMANFEYDLVCVGDSTPFTDLSSDTLNNIVSWEWIFGDGDTLVGVQHPVHLYDTAGTYTACLVVTNDAVPACSDTICLPVNVTDSLVIFAPGDTTICLGDSVPLGPLNILCGDPPFTAIWSPSAGLSDSTALNPVASPDTTTTYTVVVTDSLGATSTDSITIDVINTCCVTHAGFEVSDTLVCTYDTIFFTNTSADTTNALYFWNFGIGANPAFFVGENPPPVYYTQPGGYDVSLILQDDCGFDTTWFTVYVADIPEPPDGDTLLCGPGTVLLGNPQVAYWVYEWFPTSGNMNDSSLAQPTVQVDSTTMYYVWITDSVTGCSRLDSVEVQIGGLDILMGPNLTICPGDSAQLNIAGINCGTPPYTYLWSPGGSLSNPNIVNPVATPASTTTYTITITDALGQTADTTITVTVLPSCCQTNAVISFPGGDYCIGDTLYFTNQSTPDGPATYTWDFGANAIPSTFTGHTPPGVVFTGSGLFNVTLTISDTCTTDQTIQQVNILPPPLADAGPDVHVCDPDSITLSAAFAPDVAYTWGPAASFTDPNQQTQQVWISGATSFTLFVEDTITGCTNTDQINITFGYPNLFLGANNVLCFDSTITLDATHMAGSTYLWQDGSNDPTYVVTSEGQYHVTVTNICGIFTDSVNIITRDCNCYFTIPNVFSPNDDGYNEVFKAEMTGEFCDLSLFEIYNRWGKRVYKSFDPDPRWNGNNLNGNAEPEGTYYYIIVIGGEAYTGHVTLVR